MKQRENNTTTVGGGERIPDARRVPDLPGLLHNNDNNTNNDNNAIIIMMIIIYHIGVCVLCIYIYICIHRERYVIYIYI